MKGYEGEEKSERKIHSEIDAYEILYKHYFL